jgi:uncharacterized protein HemX
MQAEDIASLKSSLDALTAKQTNTEWQRAELSKGLSIAMRSLWANQVCPALRIMHQVSQICYL